MKNFVSVSTNAARFQDISLNPQKLAGMCAKLKCCLNYEVDQYVEASRKMPSKEIVLQTKDSDYYLFKTDILAGLVTYSTDKNLAANLETISNKRAMEIIEMNKQGEKPLSLEEDGKVKEPQKPVDLLAGESITRFDKKKKKKKPARQGRPDNRESKDNQPTKGQQENAKHQDGQQQGDQPKREKRPRGERPQRGDGKPRKPRQEGKPRAPRPPRKEDGEPKENKPQANESK